MTTQRPEGAEPRPIPDIREDMYALAVRIETCGLPLAAARLQELADATWRRKAMRKTAPRHRMSLGKLLVIEHLVRTHPDWSNQQIANHARTNSGRVTDVMQGKYDYLKMALGVDVVVNERPADGD